MHLKSQSKPIINEQVHLLLAEHLFTKNQWQKIIRYPIVFRARLLFPIDTSVLPPDNYHLILWYRSAGGKIREPPPRTDRWNTAVFLPCKICELATA